MSIVAVAWLPLPPLLVPEIGRGAGSELLDVVDAAVERVLEMAPERAIVIAPTDENFVYWGPGKSAVWSWHGFGVGERPDVERLPPWQLGLGAWLLDRHGWSGDLTLLGGERMRISEAKQPSALLVLGDGSARRDEKAPGHFDADAATWDSNLAGLLAAGDPDALLSLDKSAGERLMSTAAVTWPVVAQLLAGQDAQWQAEVLMESAPYGVGYIVATWLPLS